MNRSISELMVCITRNCAVVAGFRDICIVFAAVLFVCDCNVVLITCRGNKVPKTSSNETRILALIV